MIFETAMTPTKPKVKPEDRAYCYLCDLSFPTMEAIQEHNRKELQKHQEVVSKRQSR